VSVLEAARDRASDTAFGLGWSAVRHMPEPAAYGLFERLADRTWRGQGKGVRQLETNLARVVPEASPQQVRELSRQGMRSYLRYWCDSFRLPSWSRERIVDTFVVEDEHRLSDALASGRGAIVVLPHMGNWDHAGAWACVKHAPLTTVAERLKPESLFDRFVAYRESLGMEVLPLGGDDVVRTLARRLKDGGLVALLGDRDLTRGGVEVDLFGERAKMPAGPALLAQMTGAALLPVILWYDGPLAMAHIREELPVPATGTREEKVAAMTQQLADVFAEGIAAHPEDWHMLQRLWLADLDPAKAPDRAAP
jgi:KDO2-lipid IV(A) lauroyltransferase